MKKAITASLTAMAITLTACSSNENADMEAVPTPEPAVETTFRDLDHEVESFIRYICKRDGHQQTIEPAVQASSVAVEVLADENASPEDKQIAIDITTRPDGYEQDVARAEAAGEPVPEDSVPRTLTPEGSGSCSGWVWEQHLTYTFDDEFEDFTYETAKEAGITRD